MTRIHFLVLSCCALLLTTTAAAANDDFSPLHFAYDLPAGIYDVRAGKWNGSGIAIVGATAAVTLGIAAVGEPYDKGEAPPDNLGDTGAAISDASNYFAYGLPFVFLGTGLLLPSGTLERRETLRSAEALFETVALTAGSVFLLKHSVRRERPDLSSDFSFPSGHTALAFAAAGTLAWRYPWYVAYPSLAAAGLVAWARADSGEHYLTDVTFGAGLGLFWATAVQFHHHNRYAETALQGWMPTPTIVNEQIGLVWNRSF